jgi:uncharacterized iron-regulated protein
MRILMMRWMLPALLVGSSLAARADLIMDATSGRVIDHADLTARLAKADFLLLGEVHDNPAHHQARGELLAALPARFRSLVLEQLDQGRRLDPATPLDETLEQAGLDREGWGWPLHEPVIAAGRARDMRIAGGNLNRKAARRLALEGASALDETLARMLEQAPLDDTGRRRLEADLAAGHCGKLPASRLPNMALAQRARDASLSRTLMETGGPAVLIAGNGHARRDYGVPVVLAAAVPRALVVSVGFMEAAPGERPDAAPWRGVFDYLWFTPPARRDDPSADLKMP